MGKCNKCGKKARLVCGKCNKFEKVYYCSKECQKADWPSHKAQCKLKEAAAAAGADSCMIVNNHGQTDEDPTFIYCDESMHRYMSIEGPHATEIGGLVIKMMKKIDRQEKFIVDGIPDKEVMEIGERLHKLKGNFVPEAFHIIIKCTDTHEEQTSLIAELAWCWHQYLV